MASKKDLNVSVGMDTKEFEQGVGMITGNLEDLLSSVLGVDKELAGALRSFGALGGVAAAGFAAAAGVAYAFYDEWRINNENAKRGQIALQSAIDGVAGAISSEIGELGLLQARLDKNAGARRDIVAVVKQLKDENPGYFKDLDTERSSYEEVTAAIRGYGEQLALSAELKGLTDRLGEVNTRLLSQAQFAEDAKAQLSLLDKLQLGFGFLGSPTAAANILGAEVVEAFGGVVGSLDQEREAILGRIGELLDITDPNLLDKQGKRRATRKKKTTDDEAFKFVTGEGLGAAQISISDFADRIEEDRQALVSFADVGERIAQTFGLQRAELEGLDPALDESIAFFNQLGKEAQKVEFFTSQLAPVFQSFFDTALSGGDAFKAIIDSLKKLAARLLSTLVLAIALRAILGGGTKGLQAIKELTGGGTGVGDIFKSLLFGRGLATGGIVPPGFPNDTFPARLSSGEAVIPLDRINRYIDGSGTGVLTTRVSGSDLIIVLDRARKEQDRTL